MGTLTVTAKGQVILRKELLRHLGVAPGEKVIVATLPDGRVEIRAAPVGELKAAFGVLKKAGRKRLSLDEIARIAAGGHWLRHLRLLRQKGSEAPSRPGA